MGTNGAWVDVVQMTGLKTRIQMPGFDESITFYTEHLDMNVLDKWDETELIVYESEL